MFVYCFGRVASSPEFQRLESVHENLPVHVEFDFFGAVNQVKFGFMKAGIINTDYVESAAHLLPTLHQWASDLRRPIDLD